MRKLSSKELGVLVGAMVIGNLAHANEGEEILPVTNLDTMVVTATYSVPSGAVFFANVGLPEAGISGSGPRVPAVVDQQHAQRCASAYGSYAPNPNFPVRYANWYMWREQGSNPPVYQRTNGPTPPPGIWGVVMGATVRLTPTATSGTIFIFPPGSTRMRDHIELAPFVRTAGLIL